MFKNMFAQYRQGRQVATAGGIITRILVATVIYAVVYLVIDLYKGHGVTPGRFLSLSMKGILFVIDLAWMLTAFGIAMHITLRASARWWHSAEDVWTQALHLWNARNPLAGNSRVAVVDLTEHLVPDATRRIRYRMYHILISTLICGLTFLLLTTPITAAIWTVYGTPFTSGYEMLLEGAFRNLMVLLAVACVVVFAMKLQSGAR